MENAVKALEIAAGVLLGVILMALVTYFFSQIGSWPQTQDDITSTEQLQEFNEAYVVYNKSKMYGVDVLSCINKVISNNEKYAQGGAFLGGSASLGDYKQRENYWINIKIKLKDNLKETLTTYHYNSSNKEVENHDLSSTNYITISSDVTKLKSAIDDVGNYTTGFDNKITGANIEKEVDVFKNSDSYIDSDGYVNLIYRDTDGNASDMNEDIITLMDSIQTLGGDSGSTALTFVVVNKDSNSYSRWSRIVWQTVLYDLKSRKFKCTEFEYNTTTGRVNEIAFEEI